MNFNKKLAVAVSGAVLLMSGQVALADSATDIVDALVSKGVLTEEEGKLITKGHTSKTSVTPVVKEKDGAFILESANARNSIQLTGRIHLDYRQNNLDVYDTDYNDRDSATAADAFELRRARLGVKGKFAKDFKYEIIGNLPGTATVDVAYFDYAKYDGIQLRLGKFKQPFNLEEQTSSNNIDFMERSYVNQLAPAKKIGAMLFGQPKPGFSYAGSIYAMNDTETDSRNDKANFAGRTTLNFAEIMGNKDMVLHVGLAGFANEYNITPTNSSSSAGTTTTGTFLSYRTPGRGLSNIFRAQIGGETIGSAMGQGDSANGTAQVKSKALGLEGILAYNNFKIQGEYATADFKSQTAAGSNSSSASPGTPGSTMYDLDTQAWYVEGLWLATGEKYSDSYKGGAFGAIKPKNEFNLDKGDLGAWEFGLRYEEYNVDNMNVVNTGVGTRAQGTLSCTTGGEVKTTAIGGSSGCESKSRTYTGGVKWVLNPNAMVKFNYSRTNFGNEWEHFDLQDSMKMKHEDIIMMRTQFTF